MNSDEIILIRKKKDNFASKINELETIKNKILDLEQNPIIKEYYSLKKYIEDNNQEKLKKQIENDIDKILIYTRDSNKILYNYGEVLVKTYENDYINYHENSYMNVYRDLETKEFYFEMIDEIQLMPPEWRVGYSLADDEYYKLRKYFIEQIEFRSQNDVLSELLIKNKKLIKGK